MPSREELAAFIASAPGKVGKREIARAFRLGSADRLWLKDRLRELEDDGTLARRGKRLRANGALPAVLVAEITGRDRDGELVAEPAEWDGETGSKPRIVIVPGRRVPPGLRAAGIGDRALVRIDPRPGEGGAHAGRIVKVLQKERTDILGVFKALPSGGGRIVPVDKKAQGREVMVAEADRNGAREGDLVSGALVRSSRFGLPQAKIREVLGSLKSEKAVSLVALHAHNIPHVFPTEVLAEAESAKPAGPKGREDWRDLPLVTIDPPDAKDHDDAVHAAPDPDPDNPGGFVLRIAIADVAAYVRPGSALDREALKRGNSVYFPDRVVPMLPERISNDLCSLRQGEPRPALAARITIAADGRKKRHSFHRIMMRSAARLSYGQAQAAIDGRPDDVTGPLLEPVLKPLWAAYAALGRARDRRGPLFLDLPERKIVLDAEGRVERVHVPERLEAHRLIEEFMILANVAAAEALEKANSPLVYRVHDEPSLEKMRALGEVLASVGHKLPKAGALKPALFNGILRAFAGSEHEPFINEVVLRSQAQAVYAAENLGHFGLNLRRYAHFTSPIRRYADLVVHRALIRAFGFGEDGLPAGTTTEQLSRIGEEISAAERRAMAAERDTIDRLIAFHLADQIGATFTGRISGVTKSGLFVKLSDTGADGFVPASTIGADYYRYEERQHALVGDRTGETYRLGDTVEVKLVEAAPVAGALRFELLSEGAGRTKRRGGAAKPSRASGARKRVVDMGGGPKRKRSGR
ncbi:ribonuclease R [Enterovirga sp. DB1703]|uniref:Ribonuclease R n=1 Tax=Enterovirga aerilata TaxID=2730920 RepID=A0A849I3A9_9HYPH|nr:ribonuclease R [Enterovirga sp. DB1703]NNM72124.1 ribonuclease R [Enterovirga sp. DB1703]